MPRRAYDADPTLHGKAEALCREHRRQEPRFRLVPFAEITLDRSRNYLVQGLIPREGLVVFWGPPKCGKTFVLFDMMLYVALGWLYRGRRVAKGPVVYIACEGERGLGARVQAFRQKHQAQGPLMPPFYLLATRLDLVADARTLVDDITAQLDGLDTCAAIVIDTLNRSLNGSESSDQDMGNYIRAADRLRERFHCAVIIVHHCGLERGRPRGHTSLEGAADAQIAVTRNGATGDILAKVDWMKDGAGGDEIVSRLNLVEIGSDEDGEPITSCIVLPVDPNGMPRAGKQSSLSARQKRALALLEGEIKLHGVVLEPGNHVPASTKAIKREAWREACYKGLGVGSDKPDARRQAFNRAVVDLLAKKAVETWDDWYWPIQAARA